VEKDEVEAERWFDKAREKWRKDVEDIESREPPPWWLNAPPGAPRFNAEDIGSREPPP
jgi:hypothetical protein